MTMHDSIRQFCAHIGKDPLLVQGAGGNVSWKENGTLWIKASGAWLADAADSDIFVPVKLQPLTQALQNKDYSVIPQTTETTTLKPSIETLLHVLMPHTIVVHLHAVEVLAHLVQEDFRLSNYLAFDASLNTRTVEYFKPGATLAKAIAKELSETIDSRVVLLKNHGIIIGGDNIQDINKTINYLISFFASPYTPSKNIPSPPPIGLSNGIEFNAAVEGELHELSTNSKLWAHLKNNWALYPDHVVFLGARPFLFENLEDAQLHLNTYDIPPDVIFINGIGTFTRNTITQAKIAQLICYYNIIKRQEHRKKLSTLKDTEISELINWDSEKYRITFSK